MYRNILVSCSLFVLASCASVVRGTHQKVQFFSDPEGAKVDVSQTADKRRGETSDMQCQTPCALSLWRKHDAEIVFRLDGYAPLKLDLRSELSKRGLTISAVGNFLSFGIIGMGIDQRRGAVRHLVPNPVSVELIPNESQSATFAPPRAPKVE